MPEAKTYKIGGRSWVIEPMNFRTVEAVLPMLPKFFSVATGAGGGIGATVEVIPVSLDIFQQLVGPEVNVRDLPVSSIMQDSVTMVQAIFDALADSGFVKAPTPGEAAARAKPAAKRQGRTSKRSAGG